MEPAVQSGGTLESEIGAILDGVSTEIGAHDESVPVVRAHTDPISPSTPVAQSQACTGDISRGHEMSTEYGLLSDASATVGATASLGVSGAISPTQRYDPAPAVVSGMRALADRHADLSFSLLGLISGCRHVP